MGKSAYTVEYLTAVMVMVTCRSMLSAASYRITPKRVLNIRHFYCLI